MIRAFFVALLLPGLALAQNKKDPVDWRQAASKELTPAQIDLLAAQKFVVGDRTYRQVFTPYLRRDYPVFITTDSLLNAFHVVLEESIYRLELNNSTRLPAYLAYWAQRIDGEANEMAVDAGLRAAAGRRAKVFIGTALRVCTKDAGNFDEETSTLIAQDVQRVISGKDRLKPAWLGPPDAGFLALDYSRFQPRGFYTRSAQLERYFRAISWLQAIPFRSGQPEEALAALILCRAAAVDPEDPKLASVRAGKVALKTYGKFLGSGDDRIIDDVANLDSKWARGKINKGKFQELLDYLAARAKNSETPQINDQSALVPEDPRAFAPVSFRAAVSYRLPDAVLFQRTTDPRRLKRDWPSGLDLAAALGSPFARSRLLAAGPKELPALIDANRSLFAIRGKEQSEWQYEQASLYARYLDLLQDLLSVQESDSPDFMKSEAWQAKKCQTVLGSWAQMRHTWELQAKLNVNYKGGGDEVSGLVEPAPEFYRGLAELCEQYEKALQEAGAFEAGAGRKELEVEERIKREDNSFSILRIEELLEALEESGVVKVGAKALESVKEDQLGEVRKYAKELKKDLDSMKTPEEFKGLLADLRREHDRLKQIIDEPSPELKRHWHILQYSCRELERLSHKQLRGREFRPLEKQWVSSYGQILGHLMFHEGNSYFTPRDDPPRIADLFTRDSAHLEVGVGKPRAIYVLYPWHGKEILCRGTVLPYYEFTHAQRLTDEAWRKLLASPDAPAQPSWVKVLSQSEKK